jgi:hypothetical protein
LQCRIETREPQRRASGGYSQEEDELLGYIEAVRKAAAIERASALEQEAATPIFPPKLAPGSDSYFRRTVCDHVGITAGVPPGSCRRCCSAQVGSPGPGAAIQDGNLFSDLRATGVCQSVHTA